ncbi:hypothetical protein KAFR_0D02490 [Kazachstania africana CBS 2517]|uniref:YCII-related domain-containing protein n=1 Tax=Kazachstania africana (strain ATCC 22294 / BCRC 22015 / CBS 2517 / CECT 1963 / NBRC 1671 / NRRL Y-8276) TaxID=1071382 RepID=H2AU46_KAZAF|nr:hypothetical protein KAFR_0D02490 [Kazachstania africana CBS 2517]CCF57896.1 hypothetical protein KAFR_0D02490 [Kazachstania africana CBS 2517]
MPEWIVNVQDKPEADRAPYNDRHLAALPGLFEKKVLVSAGALIGDNGKEVGSSFQVVAESKEDAINVIKNDIFAKEGVYNLDSFVCYRFLGIRSARTLEEAAAEFQK